MFDPAPPPLLFEEEESEMIGEEGEKIGLGVEVVFGRIGRERFLFHSVPSLLCREFSCNSIVSDVVLAIAESDGDLQTDR